MEIGVLTELYAVFIISTQKYLPAIIFWTFETTLSMNVECLATQAKPHPAPVQR